MLAFWTTLLGLNAWDLGEGVASGDTKLIVFSAILCAICGIAGCFKGYDVYVEYLDDRYERKYLASLDQPVVENDPFAKEK